MPTQQNTLGGEEIISVNVNNIFYNRPETNSILTSQSVSAPQSKYIIQVSFNPIFSFNFNESQSLVPSNNTTEFLYQSSGTCITRWIEKQLLEQIIIEENQENIENTF